MSPAASTPATRRRCARLCRTRVRSASRSARTSATATARDSDAAPLDVAARHGRAGNGRADRHACSASRKPEEARVTYVKPHGALYHRAAADGRAPMRSPRGERGRRLRGDARAPRLGAARLGRGGRARCRSPKASRTAATSRTDRSSRAAGRAPCGGGRGAAGRAIAVDGAVVTVDGGGSTRRRARSACTATTPGAVGSRAAVAESCEAAGIDVGAVRMTRIELRPAGDRAVLLDLPDERGGAQSPGAAARAAAARRRRAGPPDRARHVGRRAARRRTWSRCARARDRGRRVDDDARHHEIPVRYDGRDLDDGRRARRPARRRRRRASLEPSTRSRSSASRPASPTSSAATSGCTFLAGRAAAARARGQRRHRRPVLRRLSARGAGRLAAARTHGRRALRPGADARPRCSPPATASASSRMTDRGPRPGPPDDRAGPRPAGVGAHRRAAVGRGRSDARSSSGTASSGTHPVRRRSRRR